MKTLLKRPTIDLVVLSFAFTVCVTVLASGATISWWLITDRPPGEDVKVVVDPMISMVTAIVTGLIGLISGKALADNQRDALASTEKDVP